MERKLDRANGKKRKVKDEGIGRDGRAQTGQGTYRAKQKGRSGARTAAWLPAHGTSHPLSWGDGIRLSLKVQGQVTDWVLVEPAERAKSYAARCSVECTAMDKLSLRSRPIALRQGGAGKRFGAKSKTTLFECFGQNAPTS